MTRKVLSKFMLAGVLVLSTLLTLAPQTAEAGPVRVNFTPPYGNPFPDLEWAGFVDISDGGCTLTGGVSNLAGGCAADFKFLSGTLTLSSIATPSLSQTITLDEFSSTIFSVQRSNLAPDGFQGVFATPFSAVQGNISSTLYNGTQAWFSLALLGGTDIRLYWFNENPGNFFSRSFVYQQCGKGSVVNVTDFGLCGMSSVPALVSVTAVPEPSTYALMLAGLGVMGFVARRRAARA